MKSVPCVAVCLLLASPAYAVTEPPANCPSAVNALVMLNYIPGRWGIGTAGDAQLKARRTDLAGQAVTLYMPPLPDALHTRRVARVQEGLARAGVTAGQIKVVRLPLDTCGVSTHQAAVAIAAPAVPAASASVPVPAPVSPAVTPAVAVPRPVATAATKEATPAAPANMASAPAADTAPEPIAAAATDSPTPAPVTPATERQQWDIQRQLTLMQNVQRWASMAGWECLWSVGSDYQVLADAEYRGDFPQAIKMLFSSLPPEHQLGIKLSEQDKLVWVTVQAQ